MSLVVREVRSHFPALQELYRGASAVFCDGPGGSQTPAPVIMAMQEYLSRFGANTGGQFETSLATETVEQEARKAMADLFNASPREIAFGANMTTLTYAISRCLGRTLAPGDEIIVSRLDHEANVSPWLQLAQERNLTVHWIDLVLEDCTLNLQHLQSLINRRTKLVAVGYASNFCGTVNPIARIAQWAHAEGALVYVDAVHYAPHGRIDVAALDCDFLVTSAYKHFGPHVGVLYGKERHFKRLPAYQVRVADQEGSGKFETGTPNFEGLAGICACADYLASLSAYRGDTTVSASRADRLAAAWTLIRDHEERLMTAFLAGLRAIPRLRLYGPDDLRRRVPTFALRKEGVAPKAWARQLAERNIFVWDGNFYALAVSQALGVEASGGVLRVGFLHYNTEEEVQVVLNALDLA